MAGGLAAQSLNVLFKYASVLRGSALTRCIGPLQYEEQWAPRQRVPLTTRLPGPIALGLQWVERDEPS